MTESKLIILIKYVKTNLMVFDDKVICFFFYHLFNFLTYTFTLTRKYKFNLKIQYIRNNKIRIKYIF